MKEPPFPIDEDRTDELPVLASTAAMRNMLQPSEDAGVDDTGEHTLALTALDETPAVAHPLAAEVERWAARCAAAEQALADKTLLVADLDGAMAVARRSLESQKRDTEALVAELAERSQALDAAMAEAARLRESLASIERPGTETTAAPTLPAQAAESHRLLEEYAVLAAYIDQRQQWWERAQREIVALATKAAALEHELANRDRLVADAEARAEREARRASELREQAIAYAHQVREQQRREAPSVPDTLDGEERRAMMAAELERVNRGLADALAAKSTLERAVSDHRRELAARDERIESLQRELAARRENLQNLDEMDRSLQGVRAKIAGRPPPPVDERAGPALVCLTGDAPPRVALGPSTTFGRGSQCDVQILTHYVSREHARIVVTRDGATIEDLGSRNGVYVNATKVTRQRLKPGDSIKIGETQFRFVDSVAH
jgi:hypothetical protein